MSVEKDQKQQKLNRHRAAWIQYQLRLRQTNVSALGRSIQPPVTRWAMYFVIKGKEDEVSKGTRSRIRRAVAKALGLKVRDIWGRKPVFLSSSPQPSPTRGEGNKK